MAHLLPPQKETKKKTRHLLVTHLIFWKSTSDDIARSDLILPPGKTDRELNHQFILSPRNFQKKIFFLLGGAGGLCRCLLPEPVPFMRPVRALPRVADVNPARSASHARALRRDGTLPRRAAPPPTGGPRGAGGPRVGAPGGEREGPGRGHVAGPGASRWRRRMRGRGGGHAGGLAAVRSRARRTGS